MSQQRTCHRCGTVRKARWCPTCLAWFEDRPDASKMSPRERHDELKSWDGELEIPFRQLRKRISELVGRRVTDGETAARWDPLLREILTGRRQP
jgi:hypothetical protein